MTYKKECRNCRWLVKYTSGVKCANVKSGKNNVDLRDWCSKWEEKNRDQKFVKECYEIN